MPPTPANARCLNCNYPLHSLPTNTCPECGQPFNPADPKSINTSRTPGVIARRLLTHTGAATMFLAIAAAMSLYLVSGPPRFVPPRITDTLYFLNRDHWRDHVRPNEQDYVTLLLLWFALLGFYFIRVALRLIAQCFYKQRPTVPAHHKLRRILFALANLLSIAIVLHAWPVRVTRTWIASAGPPSSFKNLYLSALDYPCPIDLSPSDQLTALKVAVTSSSSSKDRTAALNLYIKFFADAAPADLTSIASQTSDPEFRTIAIHLLSLYHRRESAELFQALLNDPNPNIRAAAADGIDILRGPGMVNPYYGSWSGPPLQLTPTPPINVQQLLLSRVSNYPYGWKMPPPLPSISFDPAIRSKLERIMTTSDNAPEREAAARALVNWPPPSYQLRAAEWGVWTADSAGDLKLLKSLDDQAPPFVHRIGNTYASLSDHYKAWTSAVYKPIIHFTADQPLALDVEVFINQGRPWLAYPNPDDLALSRLLPTYYLDPKLARKDASIDDVKVLDHPSFPPKTDFHEGYPWLRPNHRLVEGELRRFNNPDATYIGLHWQSLIVLPKPAPWMKPPALAPNPNHDWWSELRKVPSAYISSRDESERFLYYDGPTLMKSPMIAELNGATLKLTPAYDMSQKLLQQPDPAFKPIAQPSTPPRNTREAFFIRVTAGQPSAVRITLPNTIYPVTADIPPTLPIPADQTIPAFKSLLTDYGLTPEESQGLIDAWKTQFFQTNGQRLLLRLSAQDYDTLCPISIRPPPTTLVRLGFVLTEF